MKMSAMFGFCGALLILTSFAAAQEWHKVALPLCSQIKAKGARVSYRSFSVFEAPTADSKCCADLSVKFKGRTEEFGYFKVTGLSQGRHFVSFDLKTKQVVVPILVDRMFNFKDCQPNSRITVDKATNELRWEDWINVD